MNCQRCKYENVCLDQENCLLLYSNFKDKTEKRTKKDKYYKSKKAFNLIYKDGDPS